jgi:hypothetical protein
MAQNRVPWVYLSARVRDQEVGGSNPLAPTTIIRDLRAPSGALPLGPSTAPSPQHRTCCKTCAQPSSSLPRACDICLYEA